MFADLELQMFRSDDIDNASSVSIKTRRPAELNTTDLHYICYPNVQNDVNINES